MNSLFVDNTVFITRLKAGHIGRLVQALFEEWHGFEPWSSVDKIRAYYGRCLKDDELPLAFAAVDDSGTLLGRLQSSGMIWKIFHSMNIGWAMSLFYLNIAEKALAGGWSPTA